MLGGETTRIGQLFEVRVPGGAATYHLLSKDGLVPLSRIEAALVLGDPATQKQAYAGRSPKARSVGTDALRQHRAPGPDAGVSAELPASPPRVQAVPRGSALCAQINGADGGARIGSVLVPLASLTPVAVSVGTAAPMEAACVPTDATVVRPGHGALVRALHASGAAGAGTTYLVAENGVKYRVSTKDALESLGYTPQDVGSVPAPLLSTLPTGADLDPAVASGATEPGVTAPRCASARPGERQPAGRPAEVKSPGKVATADISS